jgi:hypothetical protein
VGRNDDSIFLGWLRNLLPAMRKCVGNLYGALQMNDEPDDIGMFGDLILLVGCLFIFFLLIIGVSVLVWWML